MRMKVKPRRCNHYVEGTLRRRPMMRCIALAGHMGLCCYSVKVTPAEARRVAAALVKEAEKAEKKGRKRHGM